MLDPADRVEGFRFLTSSEAEEFFLELSAYDRAGIVLGLPTIEQRWWMRALAPDDVADVIQEAPIEERPKLLALLDEPTRKEINALLAYAEDEAGGLMNPRYARLRPDMSVDEGDQLSAPADARARREHLLRVRARRPAAAARRRLVPRAVGARPSRAARCAT